MTSRVIIAGAGLGGLTLARGLRRAGIDAAVYERDPAPDSRAQGARFHIDDRGKQALHACLPPAHAELFEATLGRDSRALKVIGDVNGRLELLATNSFDGGQGRPDAVRPGHPVSRQLLRRILLHGLEDRVHFGRELVRFEYLSQGVRAYFADGGHADGDLLVGADGIGSAIRRQLLPHAEVIDTGARWLGGKSPITAEITSTGIIDLIGSNFTITELDHLGMILAAMQFSEPPPSAAARLLPGLDPGEAADFLMWALIPPSDRLGTGFQTIGARRLWELARELVEPAHPTLRLVIEQAWPEQTLCLPLGASMPIDPWQPTAVTLLGDAVHAMPPNRGSGANTALQDAARLCRHLAGAQPLLDAVATYEEEMRRDGFEAVNASVSAMGDFLLRG
ncbi:FAD-dependent monooxygenase [Nonomuraea sp. NBC_00507]|uniref:FAD-dependent oxidoreductase n=1 Tax=Nonomuraea sp. NBC_00507 TaxID=2976002 RepID=UPI002E1986BD